MNTKKAIAIGILTSAVITLVAFGIKTKAFKNISNRITTPTAERQILRVNAEEETLANTKWYFNKTLETTTPQGKGLQYITETYTLNFTVNSNTYQQISFSNATGSQTYATFNYNNSTAYRWADNTWLLGRTIQITDGTAVTNQDLVNWFKRNATKLTINNLTNTSWKIKETLPTITAGQQNASINFYNNGNLYSAFRLGYSDTSNAQANCICYGSYLYYYNSQWQWTNSDQTYRQSSRIIITGGTDATSVTLIVWLINNAEQYQEITTTLNTKWTFIDHPISNYWNYIFDIQFTSNKKSCSQLKAGWSGNRNRIAYSWKEDETTPYQIFQVYDGTYWTDNNFKTIVIINGEDVADLSVISFLTCNADGVAYQPIPTNPDNYDIENGNFVSLQSLMIQILTMPFTFISQAFNVTLWPNTAWEFNLSNFILGIIAIASLLFIIKLFTSGFSVIGKYTTSRDDREFKRSQTRLNNSKAELNNRTDPNNKRITTKKE